MQGFERTDRMRQGHDKVQVGAGLDGPDDWRNLDGSPTLWLQRLPGAGAMFRRFLPPRFSSRVEFGDVVRGLPLKGESAKLVYSSHMLEHLAYEDLRIALREIHRVLVPGGIFRGVMPDLEKEVADYMAGEPATRAPAFMRSTLLGEEVRPRSLRARMRSLFGNSRHLWLWDYGSIEHELQLAGFVEVRRAQYGDSQYDDFAAVEAVERWEGALGFECRKPESP